MTIICYKSGIIAGDGITSSDGRIVTKDKIKIVPVPKTSFAIGWTGTCRYINPMIIEASKYLSSRKTAPSSLQFSHHMRKKALEWPGESALRDERGQLIIAYPSGCWSCGLNYAAFAIDVCEQYCSWADYNAVLKFKSAIDTVEVGCEDCTYLGGKISAYNTRTRKWITVKYQESTKGNTYV